jgi:hypothetical protein
MELLAAKLERLSRGEPDTIEENSDTVDRSAGPVGVRYIPPMKPRMAFLALFSE